MTKIPASTPPHASEHFDDRWLRQTFRWDAVQHLLAEGKLLSLYYDFEATDLNTMFAAPTQFCGKIVDVQGRIIDRVKLQIQVPEDVAISPQAAIVTQSDPAALYDPEGRVPPHIAAGQILLFFRNPYRALWDMQKHEAQMIATASGREEEVRAYTVTSPDGAQNATFRIHQGGKFLSMPYPDEARLPDGANTYRDADGTRWKKIAAPAMTKGHNIGRYDDRLLWAFLHRALSDEIFLTHTKKFKRFRADTLALAKMVALLDNAGEHGFKPGQKLHPATGKPYAAFTLSSLMEANTREAVPERGLDEGVRMPDGSKYDRGYAHADAEYDVDANIALDMFLRQRDTETVQLMEDHADFDRIKPFLMGGEGFEMRPLRAFARDVFPHGAQLHLGVCVNINEEIEERRQALLIRTDTDQPLSAYTFRGKALAEMSVEELAVMLEAQRGKPDALCEVLDLRKNPRVVPAALAFARGKASNPEQHEENRRFVLANETLCDRLMQAHRKTMPPMPDYRSLRNPQAEEHLFTGIASPKRYEFPMDGKPTLLTETVHSEWVKALRRNRAIDSLLRRAVKPQTVEFEVRADTLESFIERMQSVDRQLQRYLNHEAEGYTITPQNPFVLLPAPEQSFIPPKWDHVPHPNKPGKTKRVPHVMSDEECAQLTANAVEYLWKLRAELMHEFHDNTTHFTVQDRHGHNMPFVQLNRMKTGDLADRLRTGEYRLQLESLNWSAELLARMFRDADRVAWVKQYWQDKGQPERVQAWQDWERYFDDLKTLRMHGAPHEDPDDARWMTAAKALKETARIRANLRTGDVRAHGQQWGAWDIFMPDNAKAEPILDACERLCKQQLAQNPPYPERWARLGYDHASGLPLEHATYTLPADAVTLTLDVPDRMLEQPLTHHHVAPTLLMLHPSMAERKALAAADANTYLLLRGAQSGRTYLAAKPALLHAQEIAPTPYFQEVYAAARTRFEDSGMMPPRAEDMLPLAVESLAPVPSTVERSAQTIKVPRSEDFMAMVSPVLGYRDQPLTGLVVEDDGFTPTLGIARLQQMQPRAHGAGMVETGWELQAQVQQVRSLTLAQVRERINIGREQMRAAIALGMDSVETLRTALAHDDVRKKTVEKAGLKSLQSLHKLMAKESFTPKDATHYGYASLTDMKSKITALFAERERGLERADNLLHFVDIAPVQRHDMRWHQPARRPEVAIVPASLSTVPPSPDTADAPDPSRVRGAPQIARAHAAQQRRA